MEITDKNEVIPMGTWTSESWRTIRYAIYRANNPDRRSAPVKVANVLAADAEIAIGNGLNKLVFQRKPCQWHNYLLLKAEESEQKNKSQL
jgi:hypothetical protein